MPEVSKIELIYSLIGFPAETEWLEFKEGNGEAERIGRDISALANSAVLCGRDRAYRIWGVSDSDHALVGTVFNPYTKKAKGNQDLLIWLRRFLSANANYEFERFSHDGKDYVVLTVRAATIQPVSFDKACYIREGSSTTRLVSGSAREAELWRRLQNVDFEDQPAATDLTEPEILEQLDISAYYELIGSRKPSNVAAAIDMLAEQGMVRLQDNGRYTITNLGALLVSRRLTAYPGLRKRPVRVVKYAGDGNFEILSDETFDKGYALAVSDAVKYVMSLLPAEEISDGAFRRVVYPYPQKAIRELLANAVIHQDLSDTSAGPLVSLYEHRIVFSNPGTSLIPVHRVLNAQPRTRNAALARIMRQMDLCEEGGTGWDLTVDACEKMHIAAPKIVSEDELGTQVTLYSDSAFVRMTKEERKSATYWHACLMYAQDSAMSNQSLRERFGLPAERKSTIAISRLIAECRESELIKPEDADAGDKYKRYVPSWV